MEQDARREALCAAIDKWQGIVEGKEVDHGSRNCKLCREYGKECFNYLSEEECPVVDFVGIAGCFDTPYTEWRRYNKQVYNMNFFPESGYVVTDERSKQLAIAELEFLIEVFDEEYDDE